MFQEHQATKFQMGFSLLFSSLAELVAYQFSEKIFAKIGRDVAMAIGVVSMVPRLLLTALLDNTW